MLSILYFYTKIIFRGLSQILLQENALTGLLIFLGIFFNSYIMGFGALLGTLAGTFTARVFCFNKENTESGLYGFSAALTGVALLLFFKSSVVIWILVFLGGVFSASIQHFFIKRNIPVYTLPFVLVTWGLLTIVPLVFPDLRSLSEDNSLLTPFTFMFTGFGQVIFQDSVFSGFLFFAAVCLNAPIAGLNGLVGGVLAGLLALILGVPESEISLGLYSFNAILCAIVFSGSTIPDALWVLISVTLSVVIYYFMQKFSLPALTFPFVAATVITLLFKRKAIHL